VNVFQKGYLINDRVLRPALVSCGQGQAGNGLKHLIRSQLGAHFCD